MMHDREDERSEAERARTMETVRYEVSGPAAWITIDRPESRNALNAQVQGELAVAFDMARDDEGVRVAVLTGAGDKAFSAGGDLGGMDTSASAAQLHLARGVFPDLFRRMARLGKPIVGAVNGHALAGGFGLALGCDVLIASSNATFGLPEVNIGLWPMMITPVVVRALGPRKALELMMTGERIDAAEALRLGLLRSVVEPSELRAAVDELVATLASKSPIILRLGRDAFHAASDMTFDQALDFLQAQFSVVLQCEDVSEGVAAFFQKRQPEWKGR